MNKAKPITHGIVHAGFSGLRRFCLASRFGVGGYVRSSENPNAVYHFLLAFGGENRETVLKKKQKQINKNEY
jgi:hypothetical protein